MTQPNIREVRREASERAILDAALELFAAHGYEQTSIRKIATKVGYSPGAIYSYFSSKEEIFLTLAEDGVRALNEGDTANEPSDDALEDVRTTMWRIYEFSKEQPNMFALVFIERHVPMTRGYKRAFFGEIWGKVEGRIRRCVDNNIFPRSTDPYIALRLLSAGVFAIASHRISGRAPDGEDTDDLVRDSIEVAIAGLQSGVPIRSKAPEEHPFL